MNFNSYPSYLSKFQDLIEKEREAEMAFHLNEISFLNGKQREEKGRAILLLDGKDSGTGIGGTYLVKLIRSFGMPENEISVGDIVILSKEKPTGKEELATVVRKTKRSIIIAYNNTPPHLAYQRNIRLDLFSNDITFQRMSAALQNIEDRGDLQNILFNKIELNKDEEKSSIENNDVSDLNDSQKEAIKKSITAGKLFLIHGPPGTGKTTTLTEAIVALVNQKKKILITAPSNTAVDNILEKLTKKKVKAVRIGNPIRMDEELLNHSLDVLLQEASDYQLANGYWNKIQLLQKEQNDYIPATGQHRRGLKDEAILRLAKSKKPYRGIPHSKLRKMARWIKIQQEINELFEQARKLQEQAITKILDDASVVCSTNSTAGSELLKDYKFDIVCIDEATQATEPETLIPMLKGEKWILAGDHKQLPPTVKSEEAGALRISLFERLMQLYESKASHMLSIQYRMNKHIMKFSNAEFYKGKLFAHPSIANHSLMDLAGYHPYNVNPFITNKVVDPSSPIVFIDCKEGQESTLAEGFSYYNNAEISLVQQVADVLLSSKLFPEDVGIISPYDQQVSRLKRKLKSYHIEIKSIDGFQGREKEVIILSLVRANDKGNIGFLRDYRRLNVALTRAKRKLVIIGNKETLMKDRIYAKLIQQIEIHSNASH